MDDKKLELFKSALNEAISKKLDDAVASEPDTVRTSNMHKMIIKAILAEKYTPRTRRQLNNKISAAIIASAIMLTSCGGIYKEEISGLFKTAYDEHVNITFAPQKNDPQTIEKVLALNYLPEGFYVSESLYGVVQVRYKYMSDNAIGYIQFKQSITSSSISTDDESVEGETLKIGKYDVFRYTNRHATFYTWYDGEYALKLTVTDDLAPEEIEKMILSVDVKDE